MRLALSRLCGCPVSQLSLCAAGPATRSQNIESVVDRGEHLELLMDKSDGLSSQARQFQNQSTGLRKALWWKNVKMMLMLSGLLLLFLMIVLVSVCGWTLSSCKG